MSEYKVSLNWKRETADFDYDSFDRTHQVRFSGGATLKLSAAAEFHGQAEASNPEELLAAALASCHMLTFLAIAAKSKYTVDTYSDEVTAMLDKNEEGKLAVTEIVLRPKAVFSGERQPDAAKLESLHDKAGRHCFIEASLRSRVTVEL